MRVGSDPLIAPCPLRARSANGGEKRTAFIPGRIRKTQKMGESAPGMVRIRPRYLLIRVPVPGRPEAVPYA